MLRYEALIEQINAWQRDAVVAHACERLIIYLVEHVEDSIRALTYSNLAKITQLEPISASLEAVLTTLSATYPALDLEFRFITPDGRVEEVTLEEKLEFIRSGRFSDPKSGEEIADASEFMYPLYRPRYEYLLSDVK